MHPQAEHTTHHTALHSLFDALRPLSLAPLWTRYTQLLTATPQGKARPLWRYADVRPHLLRTGELVSTQEAERRVLMLLNPGLDGAAARLRRYSLACNSSCQEKSPAPIVTRLRPSALSLKARGLYGG